MAAKRQKGERNRDGKRERGRGRGKGRGKVGRREVEGGEKRKGNVQQGERESEAEGKENEWRHVKKRKGKR